VKALAPSSVHVYVVEQAELYSSGGQQQQRVPEVLDWLRLVGAAEGEC
jgi:hypothetical protein